MLCSTGIKSLCTYQEAVQHRADARDRLLLSLEDRDQCEEHLFSANKQYGEAFVLWVNHRGLCLQCRAASLSSDLAQFMSV